MIPIRIRVNGEEVAEVVEPRTHLADVLRDKLRLTGTHLRCEQGVCGACTLLVDGHPVRSCITFAVLCDGAEVTTIEGLEDDAIIVTLRRAFSAEHALQCGYCTPAMLITARDILMRLPDADEARIRLELSGNLCRCTGYVGIVAAIRRVMAERITGTVALPARALGPAGAGHDRRGAAATVPLPYLDAASERASARPIPEALGLGARTPNVDIRDAFVVARPPEEVWALMANIARVAPCMPGASLTRITGDRVEGKISVKLGPIGAAFNGVARVTYDEARRRGAIAGSGRDPLTGSRVDADVVFALAPADEARSTRVEIAVRAKLAGPLAQFSRAGIVEDVARRLTRVFADNLERELTGSPMREGARAGSGTLNVGLLLMSVCQARLRSWMNWLRGRRKD
jgi:carbon-monoxide dehydrogenase small subunit